MSRLAFHRIVRVSTAFALGFACMALMGASRGSITKLTLDPSAPVVELFEGMEQDKFDVRMVAENANNGRIFITNKTDKPLTVAIPKGLVGVQVLPQFGNGNGFGNQLGQNQLGAGQNGQGQNGLAQTVGGNANGVNGGFPGGSLPGQNNGINAQGFFSIPPEKTVQIGLNSVCLNYGRPEPRAGMKYQLVKADSVYTDPMLVQLLEDFSTRTNRDVQQAAAWHLANGMSWEQIARITERQLPAPTPKFTAQQIQSARGLVEEVKKAAANRPKKSEEAVRSAVAAK